jgi:hypothetical protein
MLSGTPQGGVISPLLSNIYLGVLDKLWERRHAHLGELVRYCDDFVILCRILPSFTAPAPSTNAYETASGSLDSPLLAEAGHEHPLAGWVHGRHPRRRARR